MNGWTTGIRRYDPDGPPLPLLAPRVKGHGNRPAYVELATSRTAAEASVECVTYDIDPDLLSTEGHWVIARRIDETLDPTSLNLLMETLLAVVVQSSTGEDAPMFVKALDVRFDGTVHPLPKHAHPYAREAAKRLRRAQRMARSTERRRAA